MRLPPLFLDVDNGGGVLVKRQIVVEVKFGGLSEELID